jgi:hypothetical protein
MAAQRPACVERSTRLRLRAYPDTDTMCCMRASAQSAHKARRNRWRRQRGVMQLIPAAQDSLPKPQRSTMRSRSHSGSWTSRVSSYGRRGQAWPIGWLALYLVCEPTNLTLPRRGFSGYAQPIGSRWRLTDLPGPTAWGAWSDEQAMTKPCAHSIVHLFKKALSPRLKPRACAPRTPIKRAMRPQP